MTTVLPTTDQTISPQRQAVISNLRTSIDKLPGIVRSANKLARKLWEDRNPRKKYNNRDCNNLANYTSRYVIIAQIRHALSMFKFIHANYSILFKFDNKTRTLIKTIEYKRIEFLDRSKRYLSDNGYTMRQKQYLLSIIKVLKRELPNHRYVISNTLNRIFIKDVALYITEYL
jgi:hypothetical protein